MCLFCSTAMSFSSEHIVSVEDLLKEYNLDDQSDASDLEEDERNPVGEITSDDESPGELICLILIALLQMYFK